MAGGSQRPEYVFDAFAVIGKADAMHDSSYLFNCFVDTGILDHLMDCDEQRSIVIGRTGSGKTALLRVLEERADSATFLSPHEMALKYIENSAVLNTFESEGGRLDPFYKLLWRHVLLIECLKLRFPPSSTERQQDWIRGLFGRFRSNRVIQDAIEYLEEWGDSFFEPTEERIIEMTKSMERRLSGDVQLPLMDGSAIGASYNQTKSERKMIDQSGSRQKIVSEIRVSKLDSLFAALNSDILTDRERPHYVLVDRLDENWADDPIRYRLVRALIETISELNEKVANLKVILALRTDLYERVIEATADAGFQSEKYKDLMVSMRWSNTSLTELLDMRVDQLIASKYTNRTVKHQDVLPMRMGKSSLTPLQYMLARTLGRPRDVIMFFNECLELSEGKLPLNANIIRKAERPYSKDRLLSICQEWGVQFPLIEEFCKIFENSKDSVPVAELPEQTFVNICVDHVGTGRSLGSHDNIIWHCFDNNGDIDARVLREFQQHVIEVLYKCGVLGIKCAAYEGVQWSGDASMSLPIRTLDDDCRLHVHRMLWMALGIKQGG